MSTQLLSSRATLSLLGRSDFPDVLDMYSEPDTFKYIKGLQNKSEQEYLEFLERKLQEIETGAGYYWMARLSGSAGFVGAINLTPIVGQPDRIQIGWQLKGQFRGQGYASELAEPVFRFGIDKLGLRTIYGVFEPENLASKRILEKLGFTFDEQQSKEGNRIEIYKYSVTDGSRA